MVMELIIILFVFVLLICMYSLYKLNLNIAASIKSIAQFIKSRDNIEETKNEINKLKETNKDLEEEIKMGQIFYDNSKEAIAIMDKDGLIVSVNNAFSEVTGYSQEEVKEHTLMVLDSGAKTEVDYKKQLILAKKEGRYEGEVWNRRKTGEIYKESLTLTTITDENNLVVNYIAIFRDTTKESELKSKLLLEAKTDFLTKLPNRSLFFDRLEQSIKRTKRNNDLGALIFIDLDHFKSINDTLGHHVGDLLLKEVAKRMENSVRNSDTVSRLSGDEFTVILPQIKETSDAGLVAENIINSLTQPYDLDGNKINVTCSAGVSVFPLDGEDPELLLTCSDSAMYQAKETGRNKFKFYSSKLDENAHQKRDFENKTKEAIKNDDFYLKYIPITKENEIKAFEPVLVLDQEKYPELERLDVLNLTDENALIVSITEWIINKIAEKDLEIAKFNNLKVNLYLSPIYFKQSNVVEKLKETFSKEDASYINIKISDLAIAKNISEASTKLEYLKSHGFNIIIDDFGLGKISINEYSKLTFDAISLNSENIKDLGKTLKTGLIFVKDVYLKESSNIDHCEHFNTISKKDALEREEFFDLLRKKPL